MKKELIVLDFVNNGEPFEPPTWTVELQLEHDNYMSEMCEKKKINRDDPNYGQISTEDVVVRSLKHIDKKVKVSDLRGMHPMDYLDLRNAIYESGRRGIRPEENFRKLQNDP